MYEFLRCAEPLNHQSTSLHTNIITSPFFSISQQIALHHYYYWTQRSHSTQKSGNFSSKKEWMDCVCYVTCCYVLALVRTQLLTNAERNISPLKHVCVCVCVFALDGKMWMSSVGIWGALCIVFCWILFVIAAFCLRMCQNKRSQLNNNLEIQFESKIMYEIGNAETHNTTHTQMMFRPCGPNPFNTNSFSV